MTGDELNTTPGRNALISDKGNLLIIQLNLHQVWQLEALITLLRSARPFPQGTVSLLFGSCYSDSARLNARHRSHMLSSGIVLSVHLSYHTSAAASTLGPPTLPRRVNGVRTPPQFLYFETVNDVRSVN